MNAKYTINFKTNNKEQQSYPDGFWKYFYIRDEKFQVLIIEINFKKQPGLNN